MDTTAGRGTTSACAENTRLNARNRPDTRNYLRVRGEYSRRHPRGPLAIELPPRARRILLPRKHQPKHRGTTSACAENTHQLPGRRVEYRNYLRVRGEYHAHFNFYLEGVELPPRARRIHALLSGSFDSGGTTSACAENTMGSGRGMSTSWELPPRARRIPT